MLATLLRPHGGVVRVLGRALPDDGWAVRGRIGLLEPRAAALPRPVGRENLRFHARLHGVGAARVEELLERVGLRRRADDRVHTYSRGMVQRLAVCRAVLHDPDAAAARRAAREPRPGGRRARRAADRARLGRTRVVDSHDPAGGLAEADLVLGLRGGRAALLAAAGEVQTSEIGALYR